MARRNTSNGPFAADMAGMDALRAEGLRRGIASGAYGPVPSAPDRTYYVGNALINPAYYSSAMGQAELRQRESQNADQLLRRTNAALAQQANGTGAEYAEDARQELAEVAPLVRAGILGADDVQGIVKSAAIGHISERRDRSQARKEMQAIVTNHANGTFNETQTAGAIKSWLKAPGRREMAAQIPEAARFLGLEEQIKQAQTQKIGEYAKEHGLPASMLTWDDENNKPTIDRDAAAIHTFKMTLEDQQSQTQERVVQAQQKSKEIAINALSQRIRNTSTLFEKTQNPAYVAHLQKLMAEQSNLLRDLAGGAPPQASAVEPEAAQVSVPSFASRDEFQKAVNEGRHQLGKPANVAGVVFDTFSNGDVRRRGS